MQSFRHKVNNSLFCHAHWSTGWHNKRTLGWDQLTCTMLWEGLTLNPEVTACSLSTDTLANVDVLDAYVLLCNADRSETNPGQWLQVRNWFKWFLLSAKMAEYRKTKSWMQICLLQFCEIGNDLSMQNSSFILNSECQIKLNRKRVHLMPACTAQNVWRKQSVRHEMDNSFPGQACFLIHRRTKSVVFWVSSTHVHHSLHRNAFANPELAACSHPIMPPS